MGQALYRKYRSRNLGEVIGQEHITTTLERAIKAGRISHAYLFTGPKGVGKTSVARILAHQINNLPYADTNHLDIIEIDAASNRRIDDIRDLRDKVHIAPIQAPYKVYIIDEVHMLTSESFNALLKTLEEPPSHVVFILATTEAHKLPATIVSRTQRFTFRPAAKEKVVEHLANIAKKEKTRITADALAVIAEHGDGSWRDSISLLDQLTHISTGEITAQAVEAMLGLAPKEQLEKLVTAIEEGEATTIGTLLGELEAKGSSVSAVVGQLTKLLATKATLQPAIYQLIDALIEVPRAYNPHLKLLTTLMLFTQHNTVKPVAKKAVPVVALKPPAVEISRPTAELKKELHEKKLEAGEKVASRAETPDPVPTSTNTPLSDLTPEQWVTVLAAVKEKSVPLFGVLKQAQPLFDANTQTLTLKFKFQLHRKKLEDGKHKALLATTLESTLGSIPVIQPIVDTKATPPVFSADPTVTSVAAIMGGGEMINAETI